MTNEDIVERAKYEALRKPLDPISEAIETFPYGLYIIGSRGQDGKLNGMMADWLMQVAFKPRLIACSFENDARTLRYIRETERFSVNVLPEHAKELAMKFLQPADASKVKGRSEEASAVVYDKLSDVAHQLGEQTGCAILDDALAWIECAAEQFVPAGEDHTLVIASVLGGEVVREGEPLTQRHVGWSYGG